MVWQKFFPVNPTRHDTNYRRVPDERDDYSNHTKATTTIPITATTYGSGSLDATATMNPPQCRNESSLLVVNGGSDPTEVRSEVEEDGILKPGETGTWKDYLCSWRFAELVVCILPFLAAGIYFEVTPMLPTLRPLPLERLNVYDEGSSEPTVVWNPIYTEALVGETVSHRQYQVFMGLCPWLLQLGLVWFLASGDRGDAFHRTTCAYFVGIGATDTITNCVKYYVGYLRPVFLDICRPYYDESDADFRCVNDDPEGRISFPSNHSGWSFCGMLLLSMYLERCFGGSSSSSSTATKPATTKEAIFRERNRQALGRLVSLACYAPVLVAVFVAASRVADNRHFPADVIGGAVLGGSVASLVFGIWFPEP